MQPLFQAAAVWRWHMKMQESCHQSDAQKGLSASQLCTGGSQEGTGLLVDKNRAASWRLFALTNLYQLVTVSGV